MKKTFGLFLFIFFCAGCYKAKRDYLADAPSSYYDDFESYPNADSLYGDARWQGNQLTVGNNSITIDTSIVHSGNQSIRFFASLRSGDIVSKSSLLKNNFGFQNGSVVEYEAWYYIESSASLSNLFLVDFEDPAFISSGPGFRIMVNAEEEIVVERGKMEHSTLQQNTELNRKLPKNRWVKIKVEFKLSKRKKGYVKVWQDNELILEHDNVITLAKDLVYATQGTVGFLRQVEIGLTANSTEGDVIMYVDDLSIRLIQ
jgi:Polysaccharide lyase